jgi:hypothetical protein
MNSQKLSDNLYLLTSETWSYELSTTISDNSELVIHIKNVSPFVVPSTEFEAAFSLEDLINLSNYFKMCDDIAEAQVHFGAMMRFNRFDINEIENVLYFKLKMTCAIPEKITFTLNKQEKSEDQIISELGVTLRNLIKDIQDLETKTETLNTKLEINIES